MLAGLPSFLLLGFGLGLVHALDADHVLAVSTFAVQKRKHRIAWRFCARWALGHGGVLLLAGFAVFVAGYHLPGAWSDHAEHLVGAVMIGLAIWVLRDLRRQRLHLHFHRHEGLPPHAHWHRHERGAQHDHGHGATLVGALHGLAGSAPLLLLVPLAQSGAGWQGLLYLLAFSIGVLCAMLVFGGALGGMLRWLSDCGAQWVRRVQLVVALGALLMGTRLLLGVAG